MANPYDHLEALRSDVRDEIKRRIAQRDSYSVQLTVTVGALAGAAFARVELERALLAAPLVSIYFTVLILYSYMVHDLLAKYLRETIEPALAEQAGTEPEDEWEAYYKRHKVPGIRRTFFLYALWGVTVLTVVVLYLRDPGFVRPLVAFGVFYLLICGWITLWAQDRSRA